MAQFKALAVIFHSLDLTFDGKRYTDQINPAGTTDDLLAKAKAGLASLPGRLKKMNPNVNLTITPYDNYKPKVLKELDMDIKRDASNNITSRTPFLFPENFERIMKLTDPSFSMSWGQYDTVFAIVPFADPGLMTWAKSSTLHGLPGLAVYHCGKMKGAAMAFMPAHWDLSKYDGDGLQHEWLHGVSQFYKHMGWNTTISDKDADEGGDRGYSENKSPTSGQWGGWGDYYYDLMNGSVAQNKKLGNTPLSAKPGITNALWNGGSMAGDIANLFRDNGFKNAYVNGGGRNTIGVPVSDIHDWNSVSIMDFMGTSGSSAILRLKNTTDAYYLPTKWWEKYLAVGGESIGAPSSNVRSWDYGKNVELKKSDGTTSVLMSLDNGVTIRYLPPKWLERFKALGGPATLGYPNSDVESWNGIEKVELKKSDGTTGGLFSADGGKTFYHLEKKVWDKFKSAGGHKVVGLPTSDWHSWGNITSAGKIMDFRKADGSTTALMSPDNGASVWFLPPKWWEKYKGLGGAPAIGYPASDVHVWGGGQTGEIVDLKKLDGTRGAIMSTDAANNVYYLHAELWAKYTALGGPAKIGYPRSDWHSWSNTTSKGKIMDFTGTGGYVCGIMKEDTSTRFFLVKGLIWKAYVGTAGNGATSYLGYPTGEEYIWKDGLFGWFGTEYYRQDFKGGWCWASKTNAAKFGNDKNFSTNK